MNIRLHAVAKGPLSDRSSHVAALIAAAVMAVLAVPAAAQLQFDVLGKRGLPLGIDRTLATAIGDVDGDGDSDLIVGNYGQQSRLYLNNGTGTFTDATATRMPVGSYYTSSVALGDVDGDGDLDLIVGDWQQSRLYMNNGLGTFTDATATRMPGGNYGASSLALGDLDGDGDLDLVVGNGNGQSGLFLNNGLGTFTDATATRMPVGSYYTRSVVLGDVDSDGDLDLVVGNSGYPLQQSRLYLNNGQGTLTDATIVCMPVSVFYASSLALGDLDGDGDLDLVLGNGSRGGQSRLYLNNGTGTFTDATATSMPVGNYSTSSLALGDVDRDGDIDLVLGNEGQSLLLLNSGTGMFTDATASQMPVSNCSTSSLALGDVDIDGDLDLVVGNGDLTYGGQSRLYLNSGSGMFTDATASTRMPVALYHTTSLALGDVDVDGDLDMIVGEYLYPSGRQNRLLLNNGTGTFTDGTTSRMPIVIDRTRSLALGDVDGDGDLDMAIGNSGQNCLHVNDGTGTFTDATFTRMPVHNGGTHSLVLGDVDSDGDLDMVFGNWGLQCFLYLNDGAGTFTDATSTRMPTRNDNTSSLALGDVDGDGDLDMVMGNYGNNYGSGQSRLYLNNGTGTFTDATATRMPVGNYSTSSLALGDVDADGDLDLIVGNGSAFGGQTRLYLNNGTGTFTDATATRMPVGNYSTSSLALGDVDADGDPDLIVGNSWSQSCLYLNNGLGTFTDATITRMPVLLGPTKSLALGDVDGDGDADLVAGVFDWSRGRDIRLCLNLLRQFDAPFVLHVGRTYQLNAYMRNGPVGQGTFALPAVSFLPASVPLPAYGTLGLAQPLIALPLILIPQPAGLGSLNLQIPNLPVYVGITLYSQALLVPFPLQPTLSNVVSDVLIQ